MCCLEVPQLTAGGLHHVAAQPIATEYQGAFQNEAAAELEDLSSSEHRKRSHCEGRSMAGRIVRGAPGFVRGFCRRNFFSPFLREEVHRKSSQRRRDDNTNIFFGF